MGYIEKTDIKRQKNLFVKYILRVYVPTPTLNQVHAVVEFVKKNTWVVLVVVFAVLIVIGIAMS